MESQLTTKVCPRCGKHFDCLATDILQCFCQKIKLSEEQLQLISSQFTDCLCEDCLAKLSNDGYLNG
jgi:hypothetical protein